MINLFSKAFLGMAISKGHKENEFLKKYKKSILGRRNSERKDPEACQVEVLEGQQ